MAELSNFAGLSITDTAGQVAIYNDEFFDLNPRIVKYRIDQTPKESAWAFEPLYAKDLNGNIRLWQVGFDGEKLLMRSGLIRTGNYVQSTSPVVEKVSTRDLQAQALQQARTRYNDKYVEDIYRPAGEQSSNKFMQPALADKYPKTKIKNFPVAFQVKFNGQRMRVYLLPDGNLKKMTRNNRSMDYIKHVDNNLKFLFRFLPTGTMIDGEMYKHGMPLNDIESFIKDENHPRQSEIPFHIFDIYVEGMPYQERYNLLLFAFQELYKQPENPQGDKVAMVVSYPAYSDAELTKYRDMYYEQKYEGLIIRRLGVGKDSLYKPDRTVNLLKYKVFEDEEGIITDVYASKGTEDGLALFKIKDKNGGEFGLRPCGKFEERAKWLANPKLVLGRQYKFRHSGRSIYGIPQQSTGLGFRDEMK